VGEVKSLRSEDLSYIPRRGGLRLRLNVVTHTYIEAGTAVEKGQGPESCGYFRLGLPLRISRCSLNGLEHTDKIFDARRVRFRGRIAWLSPNSVRT